MENKLVVINPQEFGLEKTEAQKIEQVFTPMLDKMVELETSYNEIIALPIDLETTKRARELRLRYVKIRTGTDEIHKKAKEYYLAGGRFVDAWRNAQKFSAIGKESELEKIEKHFELIEDQKKEALNEERKQLLSKYITDVSFYNLKEMSVAGFNELLKNSKLAYTAKIEAEKQAERLRIEKEQRELEEREKIKIENAKLKMEAEAKEKEIAKERIEQEKKLSAERAKAKIETEAKLKLEEELKVKNDAELEKQRLELEAKQQAELAPDKEKLFLYAKELMSLERPNLQTKKAQKILIKALETLNLVIEELKYIK